MKNIQKLYTALCVLCLIVAAGCGGDDSGDDPGAANNGEAGGCVPDAPVCSEGGPNDGCAEGEFCNTLCACEAEPVVNNELLDRSSRSTPVDISQDDRIVAMVNTDDGSVSFFNTETESLIGRAASSSTPNSEPTAVVLSPDGKQAWVGNRATGTVSRIDDIDTAQPALGQEIEVGSEVMGLALTPTGATLYATDWTGGKVVAIDTGSMSVRDTIETGGNPFALAISNDGDAEDSDEKVYVTQFYGRRVAQEGLDTSAVGVVQVIDVGATSVASEIELAPLDPCFSGRIGDDVVTTACYPNQLYGITLHTTLGVPRAYVVSVAASPEGPVSFNHNVQAVVSVIDLTTEQEDSSRTVNLNTLVALQDDDDDDESAGRRFLSVPNAIDFVNSEEVTIGYVTSAGSDIMFRVVWNEDGSLEGGSPQAFNIATGQNPQGLVVQHGQRDQRAYTGNLISRDLSIVSFRDQALVKNVTSTDVPTDPASDAFRVWKGKRFFNTSTGIWSKEGWGSCQGCHPMGLTDNVTFAFAAGPRQSVSLDGQFASNDPSDMRALNWTAIFDETQDFELNTRGVSGGLGSMLNADNTRVASPEGPPFASLLAEDGDVIENHQALNGSLSFVAGNETLCSNTNTCPDFALIDRYIQTVRSPRGRDADAALIEQGRALFADGGCDKCHSGPKWTVSRLFYTPERFAGALPSRIFEVDQAFETPMDPSIPSLPQDVNLDSTLVAGDDSDGGSPALKRQACNIRNVATFGAQGGADEVRANGSPAQGRNGYNVPSLLGLSTGAPYLHHGAAESLDDLFDARFAGHTRAGNPNFILGDEDRRALVAFLLSIDEDTPTFAIPQGVLLCPTDF